MSDEKQETTVDILREMREGPIPRHRHDRELLHHYKTRFDAALKRECGDMAKLREALGRLRAELWNNTVIAGKRKFELYEIADAALAAPPRNCDVGTPHEQADRAFAFCLGRSCKTCEFTKLTFRECTLKWAQLPCGKGGAK